MFPRIRAVYQGDVADGLVDVREVGADVLLEVLAGQFEEVDLHPGNNLFRLVNGLPSLIKFSEGLIINLRPITMRE